MSAVMVANADRMMAKARPTEAGIEVVFVDERGGVIPFSDIPEVGTADNLAAVELPNAYEIVVKSRAGKVVELGWDFARHYCDLSYEPRIRSVAEAGRRYLGQHVRELRETAHMSQGSLAAKAGVGRATLARIESGEHSPRYDTLVALARALGVASLQLLAPF